MAIKILVIDNDIKLGKTIKNVLTTRGYDVFFAHNGAEGIQQAFEFHPDLILSGIRITPIDGYHIFKVLKESSITDEIPFIFITHNSQLDDIRYGMNLGADDYLIKPIDFDQLITSIETRFEKYNKLKQHAKFKFNTLFNLSPNGIFLSNGKFILDANHALLEALEFNSEEITKVNIEDIFDKGSIHILLGKIQRGIFETSKSFKEEVTLISKSGTRKEASLFISVHDDHANSLLMFGILHLFDNQKQNDGEKVASEVLKVLKTENIPIPHSLEAKIIGIFKAQNVRNCSQRNYFFSKRESEVLRLSIEGLPIKMIADKLAISDRTVEKHRASLMEKTGSSNIIEVIIYALRNKLIEI